MPYDLFISYSRRENEHGRVKQLVERIKADFASFAGRPLEVFFDQHEIKGMDDWRQKIQQSLRESHLFLAVLSPSYLASAYCRWEWDDYVRYEAMRQCLGEGIAPVFFVTLPDADDAATAQAITGWVKEINDRQTFDLRPWHEAGETALQQTHVKTTLDQLQTSVRERLDRAERARHSPNNLLKHNPSFVGRVSELTKLRQALMKSKLGVVGAREGNVPGRATLQGLGGMGKTELALAYAHAFAWDYPGGRWQLGCEHVVDLRVAMLQLAGPLKFEFTEDETKSLELGFERVLRELKNAERCLLVLDNVSDPRLLEPAYLDRLPRDGRVDLIVTTRLAPRSIPGSAQEQTFIAVDELPEEDAVALLGSHQPDGRFPDQTEDDQAHEIVRLLEGFTLAVETAGIYLGRHSGEVTCAQFLRDLRARLLEQSEEAAGDSTVAVRHRERLLQKTLTFTLETLTPEARHLLELAALLPADQIALPWLQAVGAKEFPAFEAGNEGSNSPFYQAAEILLGLRLFQTATQTGTRGHGPVVRMHRLVQQILTKGWSNIGSPMEPGLLEHIRSRADFLSEGWLQTENRWELGPLVACAWQWMAMDRSEGSNFAKLACGPLFALGNFADAEQLMRRALAIDEEHYGPEHPVVANDLDSLGLFLQATNRLAEAERLMRRALAIQESTYAPEDPEIASGLASLAWLLNLTNRIAEAEPLMRRALAINEKRRGPVHPDVARDLNNLAHLLQATNRVDEAEPYIRRALSINEQTYGPIHPRVAIDLGRLSALYQNANKLVEAEPLLRRALAIDEQIFGPAHPSVARDLHNLAALLQTTNRLEEAEPLIRRALAIEEQFYGPNHPEVATELSRLGQLLLDTNQLVEAEPLMRRALMINELSYGSSHPHVAVDLGLLAQLLQATNRLSEAEPILRRALAIDEQSFGPEHPNVARDLNNLAQLLQTTMRFEEAEPLTRRAVELMEHCHGSNHPSVAMALGNLAQLLRSTNRWVQAEPLMRRALAIQEQSFGPDHPDVAGTLNNLGLLLNATNRMDEAEPLMRRALAILEQSYGLDHPKVGTALSNLALLLQSTNRFVEAEPLLRRALAVDLKSYGPDHPDVATDLTILVQLLQMTNRMEEAELLSRRAIAIVEQSYGRAHPRFIAAISSLAQLLQATNRLSEAEPLLRQALSMGQQCYGPEHADVGRCLGNLAQLLLATNRPDEAEPMMQEALAINEQSYGPEHPDVAVNLSNLAMLLQATDRRTEAEPLIRRALAIDEKSFGPDHPIVAIRLNNLAHILQAGNRPEDAEPLMRRALAIDEHSFGPEHLNVAKDYHNLAQWLVATDRRGEAVPLMRRVVDILLQITATTGQVHSQLPLAILNYANLLNGLGQSRAEVATHVYEMVRPYGIDVSDVLK